jgi:hypothetical protein
MHLSKRQKNHLNDLEKDVFQNSDYDRHIQETANKLGLSTELVSVVMNNYLTNIVLTMYTDTFKMKRIIIYQFIKFFIKPFKKRNNTQF